MTPEYVASAARIAQINEQLEAIKTGWPFFMALLHERIDALTLDLIGHNCEQVRGRIKELRALTELPETLEQERAGIRAGLSEMDPAD